MLGHRSTEEGLLGDVVAKDDKIVDLQKKVEELQREKLNADWISLQEEITEYRVILTGWGTEIPPRVEPQVYEPEPEPESEPEEPEPEPAPKPVVVPPPKPR